MTELCHAQCKYVNEREIGWDHCLANLHVLPPPPFLSPGRGATIHLDSFPTLFPPWILCVSLPYRAAQWVPPASLWLTSFIWLIPLCSHRPAPRSLSAPSVLLSEVLFLPLPVSIIPMYAPLLYGLYQRPSPLPELSGWLCVILSTFPCASSLPSPCFCRLLMSSEFLFPLLGVLLR